MIAEMKKKAIHELGETDCCLENLGNMIRILAMGVAQCGDTDKAGMVMSEIAESVDRIRDQLSDAIQLVMHLPTRTR